MSDPHPKDKRYLTETQKLYYDYVREYIIENNRSPSIHEVARHFKVAGTTAMRMIDRLCLMGAMYRTPRLRKSVVCLPLKSDKIRKPKVNYAGLSAHRRP